MDTCQLVIKGKKTIFNTECSNNLKANAIEKLRKSDGFILVTSTDDTVFGASQADKDNVLDIISGAQEIMTRLFNIFGKEDRNE